MIYLDLFDNCLTKNLQVPFQSHWLNVIKITVLNRTEKQPSVMHFQFITEQNLRTGYIQSSLVPASRGL